MVRFGVLALVVVLAACAKGSLACYKLLPDTRDYSMLTDYLRVNDLKSAVSIGDSVAAEQDFYANEGRTTAWSVERGAVLAGASIAIGAASYFAAMTSVGMFGIASTGTAISALSGVAATKATLACIGGGAVAAGGGGMAAGAVVLSTGVGAIVVGVFAGGVCIWNLWDEHTETQAISYKLEKFSEPEFLDCILSRDNGLSSNNSGVSR